MRNKIILAAAAVLVIAAAGSAQSQRAGATLDDVVSELRGMRADLRQTTRVSSQMQLLTARLQLQEQRITTLANQRADVVAKLTVESQARAEAESRIQKFDEMKTRNQDLGISREELEGTLKAFQQQFDLHRGLEMQYRAQESQLSAEMANEQNRWQDFNARLDELERSLK